MKASSSKPALALGLALAGAGAAPPASAAPVTYRLDPAHTFATFEVRHFGTSTLRGRFGPLEGEVVLDREAATGEVRLTIPLSTLSTGLPVLDARLRAKDLLDVADESVAYFIATRFRYGADGGVQEVRGEFTLRDIGTPLSLYATRFACREDAGLHREVCGGDFFGDVQRSTFGATFGLPFVGNDVHLVVQVEGIATAPGPVHPPAPVERAR